MPWDGKERRRRFDPQNRQYRRAGDYDLRSAMEWLNDHDEDFEAVHQIITGLMETVRTLTGEIGEFRGELKIIRELCTSIDGKADKATSFKNAIQFAAVVIVPVLVALIGAYALLKAQAPQALPK